MIVGADVVLSGCSHKLSAKLPRHRSAFRPAERGSHDNAQFVVFAGRAAILAMKLKISKHDPASFAYLRDWLPLGLAVGMKPHGNDLNADRAAARLARNGKHEVTKLGARNTVPAPPIGQVRNTAHLSDFNS